MGAHFSFILTYLHILDIFITCIFIIITYIYFILYVYYHYIYYYIYYIPIFILIYVGCKKALKLRSQWAFTSHSFLHIYIDSAAPFIQVDLTHSMASFMGRVNE